jgi:signal peptidase I
MNKLFRFLIWSAIVAGVLIGGARLLAIRWWTVPANDPYLAASVTPTLQAGDLVLLWRLTEPKFGDLVMCPEPGRPDRIVVGRIAAEAGDTITLEGRDVLLNTSRLSSERACDDHRFMVKDPNTGTELEQTCEMENLNGRLHKRGAVEGHRVRPEGVKREVGPNQVFLLSDNRLLPWDSRDFGPVDRVACKETVLFRLWGKRGFMDSSSRFSYIR